MSSGLEGESHLNEIALIVELTAGGGDRQEHLVDLMLERVEQVGGTRAIESSAGDGTSVVVQLPTPPTVPRQSAGVVEVS